MVHCFPGAVRVSLLNVHHVEDDWVLIDCPAGVSHNAAHDEKSINRRTIRAKTPLFRGNEVGLFEMVRQSTPRNPGDEAGHDLQEADASIIVQAGAITFLMQSNDFCVM
jgi:hypothetical protein